VFGKLWVSTFCEQAEFVVKTDDDMYIDLFATYAITRCWNCFRQQLLYAKIIRGSIALANTLLTYSTRYESK
jgi:hypothetical protein